MRRWWWLSLAAFFLVGAAWAVALPANGTYDEKDHIVRAYAVATGQLTTDLTVVDRRGDLKPAFHAPVGLLPTKPDCAWSPRPARPADCLQWTDGGRTANLPSGAARYGPLYYLPVGVPLALAPDLTGIVLARLVSALLSALLLAGAVTAARRLGGGPTVPAILLAATPMAMNLAGSVNPNGLEISAGILVFSALLALVRGTLDERDTRRLVLAAGVSSVLLLTVRQFGPVLLAMAMLGCAVVARSGRLRELWRRRDVRWVLGGAWALGLAFTALWLWYSGLADIAPNARDAVHLGLWPELRQIATGRMTFYVRQLVGMFGYGETDLPYAHPIWYVLVAAVVVPCLVGAPRRFLVATVGLALTSAAFLAALDLYFLPRIGWFAQGRYAMAALVGVVLIPSVAGPRLPRWYRVAVAVPVALLHAYALDRVMTRFRGGPGASLDPFQGPWRPVLGPVPPLLLVVIGGALLVALCVPARRVVAVPTLSEPSGVPERVGSP